MLAEEASIRKQAAIFKAVLQKPARDPKRLKKDPDAPLGPTPLLDFEQAERRKWAARLEEIGKRAGPLGWKRSERRRGLKAFSPRG